MNNLERYSKVHDVSFDAEVIGAAEKESFLMGAEYVLDNLLPRFKSIEHEWPEKDASIIYVTKNRKVGILSKGSFDGWYIEKYSISHWMLTEELLSLMPL